jgi:hypothetical protein
MPTQSSAHFFLNWAKERIDEMDASVGIARSQGTSAESRSQGEGRSVNRRLEKAARSSSRPKPRHRLKERSHLASRKAQLESQWNGFEAQIKTYFETVGKQIEQQQTTFQDIAAAQVKAWREAADKFNDAATKSGNRKTCQHRCGGEQMKAEAAEAERTLAEIEAGGKRILGCAKWRLG